MYYKIGFFIIIGFMLASIEACSEKTIDYPKEVELKNQMDSVAYVIGINLGRNFKNDSLMIDINVLATAIHHALYTDSVQISDEQSNEIMTAFQMELQVKQQEKMLKEGQINKEKGEKFLADNKNKPGVKTTESGLQYRVLKEGTGKQPAEEETVRVHYKGTTLDGKVFDSSYDGEPIEFPLNRVIKGWTEGLQLMKEGAKYKFFIPSELAYGSRGAQPHIGADETLIFEVELLKVLDKK